MIINYIDCFSKCFILFNINFVCINDFFHFWPKKRSLLYILLLRRKCHKVNKYIFANICQSAVIIDNSSTKTRSSETTTLFVFNSIWYSLRYQQIFCNTKKRSMMLFHYSEFSSPMLSLSSPKYLFKLLCENRYLYYIFLTITPRNKKSYHF